MKDGEDFPVVYGDPGSTYFYGQPTGYHAEAGYYIPIVFRLKRHFSGKGTLFANGGSAYWAIFASGTSASGDVVCGAVKNLYMTVTSYKRVSFRVA